MVVCWRTCLPWRITCYPSLLRVGGPRAFPGWPSVFAIYRTTPPPLSLTPSYLSFRGCAYFPFPLSCGRPAKKRSCLRGTFAYLFRLACLVRNASFVADGMGWSELGGRPPTGFLLQCVWLPKKVVCLKLVHVPDHYLVIQPALRAKISDCSPPSHKRFNLRW